MDSTMVARVMKQGDISMTAELYCRTCRRTYTYPELSRWELRRVCYFLTPHTRERIYRFWHSCPLCRERRESQFARGILEWVCDVLIGKVAPVRRWD